MDLNLDSISFSQACLYGPYYSDNVYEKQPQNQAANAAASVVRIRFGCWHSYSLPKVTMRVCDVSGNCATLSENTPIQPFRVRAAAASVLSTSIFAPLDGAVLSSTAPISLTGIASGPDALDALTVTVNGVIAHSTPITPGATSARFSFDYTPAGEGVYVVRALARSGATMTQSEPVTFTIDVSAPLATFDAPAHPSLANVRVLTQSAYVDPAVLFSGALTDTSGLASARLQIGEQHFGGIAQDGRWQIAASLEGVLAIDGSAPATPVTITLTDRAGNATTLTAHVIVDVVGGQLIPAFNATGVSFGNPSDAGITGYYYGKSKTTVSDTLGALSFAATNNDPLITLNFAPLVYPQGEDGFLAQPLLIAIDALGNQTTYRGALERVDNPRTPDYLGLIDGASNTAWLENSCSLLGEDLRIPRTAQDGAALRAAQALHATWNNDALRVAWRGADWDRDGDLFIYFDTKRDDMPDFNGAGYARYGSNVAYNPYSATNPSTLMLLPVQEWTNVPIFYPPGWPDLNRVNADLALWVENNTTAHWLRWSDATQTWERLALPQDVAFNHDSASGEPLTEFTLPFTALGIASGAEIEIVAFASDDNALRVWSAVPAANPASSARVMPNAVPAGKPLRFMLSDRSTLTLDTNNCRAPAQQTTLELGAQPDGVVYASREDALRLLVPRFSAFSGAYNRVYLGYYDYLEQPVAAYGQSQRDWLRDVYCPANPYDLDCNPGQLPVSLAERMASIRNTKPATLVPGERVTYTVRYNNAFTTPRAYPLHLQGVAPGNFETISWDEPAGMAWTHGCPGWLDVTLPAQAEGVFVFTGVVNALTEKVDIDFAPEARVTPGCGIVATTPGEPYNRLTAHYVYDTQAPFAVSIDAPRGVIGQGGSTLRGSLVDQSHVPTITVEFDVAGGAAQTTVCANESQSAGEWSCPIDIGAAAQGTTVQARARGSDVLGQQGAFGAWVSFTVDAQAPTVPTETLTVQNIGTDTGASALTLSGVVSDDTSVQSVDVCSDGACQTIDIGAAPTTNDAYAFNEAPTEPITITQGSRISALSVGDIPPVIGVCAAVPERVIRQFTVDEAFTIARVSVGLNVSHPYRSDLRASLIDPSGAGVDLLVFPQTLAAQNLDVLLNDQSDNLATDERGEQNIELPFYDTVRKPSNPLSAFEGKAAQGVWQLVICDVDAAANEGALNRAQLVLQGVPTNAPAEGQWSYDVPVPENTDGVVRTYTIFGRDALGNRAITPRTVTLTLDNVAPALVTTQTWQLLDAARSAQPIVLSGVVSDGAGVQSMLIVVEDAHGQQTVEAVSVVSGTPALGTPGATTEWVFTLNPRATGRYRLTVQAADPNGNVSTSAPFFVDVGEAPAGLTLGVDIVEDLPNVMRSFATNLASGADIVYTFDFGDGTVVTGTSPLAQHAYAAVGEYTATVSAGNAFGVATQAVAIRVLAALPTPTPYPTPGVTETPSVTETPGPTGTPTDIVPQTPTSNRVTIYLPVLSRDPTPLSLPTAPDLAPVSLSITPADGLIAGAPAALAVTIRNNGNAPAGGFWVELYIDPARAPVVNETWTALCNPPWPSAACYGGSWHVTQTLAPGESITLSGDALVADRSYSRWPGSFAQPGNRRVVVRVDSYAPGNASGAVAESNENNNSVEASVTVVGAAAAVQSLEGFALQDR